MSKSWLRFLTIINHAAKFVVDDDGMTLGTWKEMPSSWQGM